MLSLAGAGLATAGFANGASALCGLYPPATSMEFQATKQGQSMGWRRIAFFRQDRALLVLSESDLTLGPRRKLRQKVQEIWQDGWLVDLAADTWEDGRHYDLRAERKGGAAHPDVEDAQTSGHGGGLAGQAGRLRFNVSGHVIATTFWHRDTPYAQALLSVIDGLVKIVQGNPLPETRIRLGRRDLPARGWQLRGEFPCSLWYDADCRLLRFAQPDERGRNLVYARLV
ncbi:MAG: DUF6134 family protein [Kiloniellales bacterium]